VKKKRKLEEDQWDKGLMGVLGSRAGGNLPSVAEHNMLTLTLGGGPGTTWWWGGGGDNGWIDFSPRWIKITWWWRCEVFAD